MYTFFKKIGKVGVSSEKGIWNKAALSGTIVFPLHTRQLPIPSCVSFGWLMNLPLWKRERPNSVGQVHCVGCYFSAALLFKQSYTRLCLRNRRQSKRGQLLAVEEKWTDSTISILGDWLSPNISEMYIEGSWTWLNLRSLRHTTSILETYI